MGDHICIDPNRSAGEIAGVEHARELRLYCPKDQAVLDGRVCPVCGTRYDDVDGIAQFHHATEAEAADYDPRFFAQLAAVEDGNFWFEHRNELIVEQLRLLQPFGRYLEIGCGTGFVLRAVTRAFPELEVWGSEMHARGLQEAQRRVPRANFAQLDARRLPFQDGFNFIGMYDVIEHIEEDRDVLQQVHRALMPGGQLLLTVPQHSWLWSEVDELSGHKRRYEPDELPAKLRDAGFEVEHASSFVTLLAPVMWAARKLRPPAQDNEDVMAQFNMPSWMNRSFGLVMSAEKHLQDRLPFNVPMGSSQIVRARRLT